MLRRIDFMAMDRSHFERKVEDGMYQFFVNLLKIYLIKNQTYCFQHWSEELSNTYWQLREAKKKNNQKYTGEDVIRVYEEDLDVSDLDDVYNFSSHIKDAVDEVNKSEDKNFSMDDVDIDEIRELMLKILSKTCSSDWNKTTICQILAAYDN